MAILQLLARRVFIILNIITVLLFLLACANAFLHPGRWWLIALLGLIFPLLLLLLVCFVLIGIFLPGWRRWSLISFLALLIGWSNIHSFLALHPFNGFNTAKAPGSVRVLTWNIRSFDEWITKKKGASGHREKMLEFIAGEHPDVVCLQEFLHSHQPTDSCNIPYYQQRLHLPYFAFSHDYTWTNARNEKYESGVAILSRYPIVDSMIRNFARPGTFHSTESLISADLLIGKDTLRVFTTHLQSVLFHDKDFHDIEIIKNVDDSILMASRSIAKKLGYAFRHRADQAREVREELDKCPYPGIICGDFNDVPNSYTYFTIRKDWEDAFLQKGFGIGRTYVHISPTLRIDYILADRKFSVLQCRKFSLPWSDHNPVVADLRLPATAPR
jgi:endonuclease/exonuclease/phosphatase family metal-dependent hydrolase